MPSINEKIKDLTLEQAISLQRLEADAKKNVTKRIRLLEQEIIAAFLASDIWQSKKKQVIQARLTSLFKETQTSVEKAYNEIAVEQAALLTELAVLVEKQSVNNINKALDTKYTRTKLSKKQLDDISKTLIEGAASEEWWGRRSIAFQNKFKDTVRDGILKGKGSMEIARELEGSAKLRKKDGLFRANYRSAELLVRTSIHSAANQAREATFENNSDIIRAMEWVATLDARTTLICQALDGLIWDVTTKKPIGHNKAYPGPSAHWGERSIIVPVIKKYNNSMKILSSETRASMNGQVSAKLNYESWLKTKSKAFQIDVLGPKRHKLWIDDKIKFTDLTNQDNNPLTIKQLNN